MRQHAKQQIAIVFIINNNILNQSAKMPKVYNRESKKEYVLDHVIGQGCFGRVYYCHPHAVKEIKFNKYLPSFEKQKNILKNLKHPNIVHSQEIFQDENRTLYIVMEYCQMDLSQYINNRRVKIDEQLAIDIFKQILAGLKYLVQKGIIHRDLKPANILVKDNKQFKIADFGLARQVQGYNRSMLSTIAGTPLYMAPQLLMRKTYTTKCDIWSAGIIFYELLTGQLPYTGSTQAEIMQQIEKRKPLEFPRNISETSKSIIFKMIVVEEVKRIGWQDLFKHFENIDEMRAKEENRFGCQPLFKFFENNDDLRAKSASKPIKLFTPYSNTPKKENRIFAQSPRRNEKQYLTYPANKLKEMLIVDMRQFFDEVTVNKILGPSPYRLGAEQIPKIKEVFSGYNRQLQAWFLKDIPNFSLT